MEYTYFFSKGELSIKTPGVASMAEVKNEILEQTSKRIVFRSTYPNGFQATYEVEADMIIFRCNQPLIDNGDGSFSAPTDT